MTNKVDLAQRPRVSMDEWNNEIMPLVGSGEIVDRPELASKGFLVFGQVFESVLEQEEKFYRVVGWKPPGGDPFVTIDPWNGQRIEKIGRAS